MARDRNLMTCQIFHGMVDIQSESMMLNQAHQSETPHEHRMDGQPSLEPSSTRNDQLDMKAYITSGKVTKKPKPHVKWEALIDRGANGCIAGRDVRVIAKSDKTINLSGLDDHTVRNLNLVTAGAMVRMQLGKIIIVFYQVADIIRDSKTILSAG